MCVSVTCTDSVGVGGWMGGMGGGEVVVDVRAGIRVSLYTQCASCTHKSSTSTTCERERVRVRHGGCVSLDSWVSLLVCACAARNTEEPGRNRECASE